MITERTVNLKDALPLLARSQRVRRRLMEAFEPSGQWAMLKKMTGT